MSLRDYVRKLDNRGDLVKVTAPISKTYEIAGGSTGLLGGHVKLVEQPAEQHDT